MLQNSNGASSGVSPFTLRIVSNAYILYILAQFKGKSGISCNEYNQKFLLARYPRYNRAYVGLFSD